MAKMTFDDAKNYLKAHVASFARKVAPLYSLLQWSWHETGVPKEYEIEEELNRLIRGLDDHGNTARVLSSECGGLWVRIDTEEGEAVMGFTLRQQGYWYDEEETWI